MAAEYILKQSIADVLNSYRNLDKDFWNINKLPFDDFAIFVSKLLSTLSISILEDSHKIQTFKFLQDSAGSMTVEEISGKVCWTARQINRYFKSKFGLSIKTYANILRCSSSYSQIRDGDISSPINYYDQSHFIKEIKKYTGSNPKKLHENKNDRFLQFSTLPKV